MELIGQLRTQHEEALANLDAFYNKGNKSAGTRARKNLQEIKKLSQSLRVDIQETKNNAM